MKSNYHPDYGIGDTARGDVLADAMTMGVAKAASKHRVSVSSVYRWRRDILQSNPTRRPRKAKPAPAESDPVVVLVIW
jgi:hypothetical protein